MIGKKYCPHCGSEDIQLVAGGSSGAFMCADCGYSGSVFPERAIVGRKEDDIDMEGDEMEEELGEEDYLELPLKKAAVKKKVNGKIDKKSKTKSKSNKGGKKKK